MTLTYMGLMGKGLGGGIAATKPPLITLMYCHSERNVVK